MVIRPDHNLQDVRAKIFPFKRRKVNAPEVVPSTTLPARRKERSLSSLVVSTPRVSTQTSMTGRRSRAVARKAAALQGSRFSIEKLIKKEEDSVQDHPESSSSPEISNKFPQNNGQVKKANMMFPLCLPLLLSFFFSRLPTWFCFPLAQKECICSSLLIISIPVYLTGIEFSW